MYEVTCWDSYDRVIEGLTQWDINQTLFIKDIVDDFGLTEAPMFHFCNQKSKEALVVPSTIEDNNVIAVKVPNILLQEAMPLFMYMYVYSDSSGQNVSSIEELFDSASAKTLVAIKITVRPRAKPSEYQYVENIDSLTAVKIEDNLKKQFSELANELRDKVGIKIIEMENAVDSKISELEELTLQLEDWLADSDIATQNTYISSEVYEVETDDSGCAVVPFSLEDTQIACVFINSLIAVEEKDYQIINNNIQLTNSEFISGNDIVTFVTFKPTAVSGNTISLLSEVYEAETDSDGYAQLPFAYDNQMFHVFINGVLAAENDYQIANGGILTTNTELTSGNDAVTFVVFKPLVNGVESKTAHLSSRIYNTQTDNNGKANIPLIPKTMLKINDSSVVQVYINGLFGIDGTDYQIENGNIQLIGSEAISEGDVITFITFEAKSDDDNIGNSTEDITSISTSEIDEIINR